MPNTSETSHTTPSVLAENVWVKFLIRYYRREVTVRETLVGAFDRWRKRREDGGKQSVFCALSDINLSVYPGETLGIVGSNGSGKTTLLKTLAGILGPDQGQVAVRGKVGCLLSFGVGFNSTLSGRENVYLNGSILGLSRKAIDERFEHIVEMSELGNFINAPVRTYSAGMKGRLGFSIAVHIDPDVLMLDEVLSVGDAAFRAKVGDILSHLQLEQKTIVIASHDMNLIRKHCDRAIWLDHGRITMYGTPEEVTEAYLQSSRSRSPAPKGEVVHAR